MFHMLGHYKKKRKRVIAFILVLVIILTPMQVLATVSANNSMEWNHSTNEGESFVETLENNTGVLRTDEFTEGKSTEGPNEETLNDFIREGTGDITNDILEEEKDEGIEPVFSAESTGNEYILDPSKMIEGSISTDMTVNGFQLHATSSKFITVEGHTKTAEDGVAFTSRIKLNGTGTKTERAISFTSHSEASLIVYGISGSSSEDRNLAIYTMDGSLVHTIPVQKSTIVPVTVALDAGSYYMLSPSSGVNIYYISLKYTGEVEEPERTPWNEVSMPVIYETMNLGNKISISFHLETGIHGADKGTVVVFKDGIEIDKIPFGTSTDSERVIEYVPTSSGTYAFQIIAERNEEETLINSELSSSIAYRLPLTQPIIKGITNLGGGKVNVEWNEVKEATSYEVYYKSLESEDIRETFNTEELSIQFAGLAIGNTYTFFVQAINDVYTSPVASMEVTITNEGQRAWYFSAFGQGVDTKTNYYIGNANEGSVTVASESGKGKLVPLSTDGLAYYYTTIDPINENFIFSADITVDDWTYSNGQEGFGLMVADAVGINGDSSVFWNNSYMASVTKVEYLWDTVNNKVSDNGEKVSMKLGIGAQEKIGVTKENIEDDTINTRLTELFKSSIHPIETSKKVSGTYNIIGNYRNASAPTGTVPEDELLTTFRLTIQRDNTGYRLSYTDKDGNTQSKLFYDIERDAMTKIDKENIYVGFFASRNAKITATNISLTTTDPKTDPPAEGRDITYVTPKYEVLSSRTTGSSAYELVYHGNADGTIVIKDKSSNIIYEHNEVKANTYVKIPVTLDKGTNTYIIEFQPNPDYKPSEYERLINYDAAVIHHTVDYKTMERTEIYISPIGRSTGDGSKNHPLDVQTAFNYASPGQKLILMEGTYVINSSLKVERGISGSRDNMIYLISDPANKTRPVFDFNNQGSGIVLAGDYWYMQGFDVTKTGDMQKGISLVGDNCVLDNINTYNNGNTGIQISRYLVTDNYDDWPSNNLILNCTSYGNADRGYEDADGFAAKLTIGEGNVFDGCIAYNNADDGWDLFAKPETGPIGKVIIKNCVAYGNGYLPDGTDAGNGNGFKLGGSSITGYHELRNSVAFNNKAKGIDSNSCQDIMVYNSTTFNNESYNVAFYTSDAANTDYYAQGVLSYRTESLDIDENIKPKGTQDNSKIYGVTNYYWNVKDKASMNSIGDKASEDWFVSLGNTQQISRSLSQGITRYSDGTINMNGFLVLTDKVPEGVGAVVGGRPSAVISLSTDQEPVVPSPTPVDPSPTPVQPSPTPVAPTPSPVIPTTTPVTPTPVESTPSPTDIPVEPMPLVFELSGDDKEQWNDLIKSIKEVLKDSKSDTPIKVELTLGKTTKVSKDLLKAIQGTNTILTIKFDDSILVLNGEKISGNKLKDIDIKQVLEVTAKAKTHITVSAKDILYVGGSIDNTSAISINVSKSLSTYTEQGIVPISYTFKSSNTAVASVNSKGLITAKKEGSTKITATVTLGQDKYTYTTKVKVVKASIKFINTSSNMTVGESKTFTIEVKGYSIKDVTWYTTSKKVATVSRNKGSNKAVVKASSIGKDSVLVTVLDSQGKKVSITTSIKIKAKK